MPPSGAALLDVPLAASGLTAANVLARAGRRLGVDSVRDLLFHLPKRYDDLRELRHLGDLQDVEDGDVVSAPVEVRELRVEQTFRRRVQRTIAHLADGTGFAEATWFGRRYIERRLKPGDTVVISGRIKRRGWSVQFDNPEFQRDDGDTAVLHAGRIVPVYRLTQGLTAARLRTGIREALDRAGGQYPEYLPASIRESEGLVAVAKAVEEAHYPESFEGRDAALRRLAFDELFALQLGMVQRRRQRSRTRARPIGMDAAVDRDARAALAASLTRRYGRDIALTDDQAAAMDDVRGDITRDVPMLRLLQGDVGSGKTAVAAYALAVAALAGRQAALLAPTDLLARQHAATLADLLEDLALPVTLLTGSLSGAGSTAAREAIANGMATVVVGTHALLQESVSFANLGLAVIDEQHRFGVEQRGQLEAKAGALPHVLLMTATPIPRTLGQVLYADLDVSNLRSPPSGRLPVATGVRSRSDLDGTWQRVRVESALGHGTFVVVPLVEESEVDDGTAAEAEFERLKDVLSPLRVGLVHGRMRAADRDAEMARFRDGDLDVLVGTTVIEVGVDIATATMMVVEDADRFGLAQLHQLRGRVGRGDAQSYCVLVSDSLDETARARLEAVRTTRDGFVLAERDFELRREGDVLGLTQSGLPRLRVASLARRDHQELAVRARRWAEDVLDESGSLRPAGGDGGEGGHGAEGGEGAALQHELEHGWLRKIAEAEPASAA